MRNTAPATQNFIPCRMGPHQILRLPRKMTLLRCPSLPRDLHVVTTRHSPNIVIRKITQHDRSKVLCLTTRKMTMEVSKARCLPRKMQLILCNLARVLCLSHKTTFDTLSDTRECHEVPRRLRALLLTP